LFSQGENIVHKKFAVFVVLLIILLCGTLLILARQDFNDDYEAKRRELEATSTSLTLEAIREGR
jgi:hypothetical protein